MLRRGLKSLDELDAVEEVERVVMAKIIIPISDFDFSEILLDSIKVEAFWVSLDSGGKRL
jgi:hypothetical protein